MLHGNVHLTELDLSMNDDQASISAHFRSMVTHSHHSTPAQTLSAATSTQQQADRDRALPVDSFVQLQVFNTIPITQLLRITKKYANGEYEHGLVKEGAHAKPSYEGGHALHELRNGRYAGKEWDVMAWQEMELEQKQAQMRAQEGAWQQPAVPLPLLVLDLSSAQIGIFGARVLAHLLRKAVPLSVLLLPDNDVEVCGAEALCQALRFNSRLTTFDFCGNVVKSSGAKEIALALRGEDDALALAPGTGGRRWSRKSGANMKGGHGAGGSMGGMGGMGGIGLGAGTKTGGEAASACRLRSLNLRATSMEADGLQAIADALRSNSVLTALNISANDKLTEDSRNASMKQAMHMSTANAPGAMPASFGRKVGGIGGVPMRGRFLLNDSPAFVEEAVGPRRGMNLGGRRTTRASPISALASALASNPRACLRVLDLSELKFVSQADVTRIGEMLHRYC
jgi:hypothetical protein